MTFKPQAQETGGEIIKLTLKETKNIDLARTKKIMSRLGTEKEIIPGELKTKLPWLTWWTIFKIKRESSDTWEILNMNTTRPKPIFDLLWTHFDERLSRLVALAQS
ncbi:MAG: hypothetical protein LBR11_07405 [Deltaproteobacteria bacterium]|nr:hypothetical protein [Deltaproteobacteria bacterium]